MSDAKSAAEIEDILSSIRRLVTEERKPAPAPRPQILSRLVVEDRLVLTPAQRVKPAVDLADPFAKVTLLRRPEADPVLHAEAPEAPMALDVPLAAEPAPRLHLAPPAAADSLAWEAEMGDPAPEVSHLDWSSFTFARRPMAETYAARVQAAERLSRPEMRRAPVSDPMPNAALVLRQPALEPQPAIQIESAIKSAIETGGEAEPMEARQTEDNIFSEEILRELVRDLIREQLQGDLGERITRNIRKLVKAEIARSLTLRAAE